MCRRHVRQGSAASSGPGSGWAGTRGRRTTGSLSRWPEVEVGRGGGGSDVSQSDGTQRVRVYKVCYS